MSDAMAKATSPATQVPEDAHHVKFEGAEAVVNNDEQGNNDVPEGEDNVTPRADDVNPQICRPRVLYTTDWQTNMRTPPT